MTRSVDTLEMVHVDLEGDGLARVTMDRPPANALSPGFMTELDAVCEYLEQTVAKVAVLESAAPMFMAGFDLKSLDSGWDQTRITTKQCQLLFNRWERLPMMTIAVISGHATGAGCEFALACDWRLMAKGKPRIGLPEVQRGLLPGGGGTQRMTRLIGHGKALDLCLRGELIGAEAAEKVGLVSEAVDAEQLSARDRRAGKRVAVAAPIKHPGDQALHSAWPRSSVL